MQKVNWGIIGCGDVTEVKSGPAFNKVPDSALVAVMRRDAVKAADYAARHSVPRWYGSATELINDAEVNAIYIATPPASHAAYALEAIRAGKPVYLEKPMAMNAAEAETVAEAADKAGVKLVVAHYRRKWPLFLHIKKLLLEKAIGEVRFVKLDFFKKMTDQTPENMWRLNAAISGGGLFHDLAPHQLDILYNLFGPAKNVTGNSASQCAHYAVDDVVAGSILFENKVMFSGSWCFNAPFDKDHCEITGSEGTIQFSFFGEHRIDLTINGNQAQLQFDRPMHVQQNMIEHTVNYFLGKGKNPCSGGKGAVIMHWIDAITTAGK